MIYPEIPLAQSILQLFKAKGLRHIIISPGSRNAPLTIGLASDPFFTCYSIVDERCAAFFALGIAQQTQEPAVLVCTSGSALLNYYPALAEAFYSQIPLIVLSADRPKEKIDIGDGQTIRQSDVYANHSLFNANLSADANHENDHLIQKSIMIARTQKGPVHINAPFEEPLYNTLTQHTYYPHLEQDKETKKTDIDFIYYKNKWQNSDKKLLLIGSQNPLIIPDEVIQNWTKDPSLLVFTEVSSNVYHPLFVSSIDGLITGFTTQYFEALQPNILITIGGMIVSKRVKSFLRNYPPQEHWHIDTLRFYDTFGSLTDRIICSPEQFFSTILTQSPLTSSYRDTFLQQREQLQKAQNLFLATVPFSDLSVFQLIWKALPNKLHLQISNSSPIRYAQLFTTPDGIEVFCNRGTSGIDGSTSTAIGAAQAQSQPTLLITGDISFFYDSNALWNNYIPKHFKIILINNGGGGIFRILPGHQENETFHRFFETQHHLTASHLAKMYQLDYKQASDHNSTQSGLDWLFSNNEKASILEIFTPTAQNQEILKAYFQVKSGAH